MNQEAQKQEEYERKAKAVGPQSQQGQPGIQQEMHPKPIIDEPERRGSGKLEGRVALISGGDSGIGAAVAVAFAKEGADVAIIFLDPEVGDAVETQKLVEKYGRRCLPIPADIRESAQCNAAVQQVISTFGKLDILVNNAAWQAQAESLTDITDEQLDRTFRTNVYGAFYLTRAALPHLKKGASIINTTSVTAYRGSPKLLDYSATKAALAGFTRSLSQALAKEGIRVNGVAPGPIWTPFIPSSFPADKVASFGEKQPLGRMGQPVEVAPAFVFLASLDASYMSGQVLHPNGGEVVNG